MKKVSGVLLFLSLVVLLFPSCEESGSLVKPTEAEAGVAYQVASLGYVAALFSVAFDSPVEGVSFNTSTGVFTFTNMDITSDDGSYPYTSMSGTITPVGADSIAYDVTLEGGPVITLEVTVDENASTIVITANGYDFSYTI